MGINDSEKSMNTGSTDEYKSLYDCLAGEGRSAAEEEVQ
jgi:hypothetical protein